MNREQAENLPPSARQFSDTLAAPAASVHSVGRGDFSPFQAHYKAGLDLMAAGEVEKAAKKFSQAAIASPEKFCEAAIEIGRVGDPKLAMACLSELLRLSKTPAMQAGTWCAIGNIYSNAGCRPYAMECFIKSWNLNPHPGSASNRALIHLWNEEIDEAERWIALSIAMDQFLPETQFVQSMITLVGRGDYQEGFQQYECRWRNRESGLKKIPSQRPEWPGPKANKGILLVYGEQGMGDTILTLRYARLIKELGLKQVWVVQPPVKTLAESMGIIDEVKVPGQIFTDYDYHIPAISLIRCFGTSLENIPPAPYLGHRYGVNANPLRVGICWQGSSVNRNNPIRSAPLTEWGSVLAVEGVEFHCFQVDGWQDAIPYMQIKLPSMPKDWLETARGIGRMDLIISVDTALVHLAGAMGVPCWCALHCRPYFVYPLVREDCPWYSSVRLFRQKKEHEWKPVFEEIAIELKKLL